jgi:hypothetical protein
MGSVACVSQATNIGTTIFIAPEVYVLEHGHEQPGMLYPIKNMCTVLYLLCIVNFGADTFSIQRSEELYSDSWYVQAYRPTYYCLGFMESELAS